MALPLDKLGTTYGPVTEVIDGDRARAYAAATVYEVGPADGATVYAFEAASGGVVVVEHGLAEVA